MNFIPVISHAIAILLGWLAVSFATLPDPAAGPTRGTGHDAPPWALRSGNRHSRPSPGALLARQANIAMSPTARTRLKERILTDWGRTDPDGLLRYLDGRPWLARHTNAATVALQTLARSRPAALRDYARREGCGLALRILGEQGDPRLVLGLLLTLPEGTDTSGNISRVFERGCRLDPGFHACFDEIGDPGTRRQVFRQIVGTLLHDRREDELLPWVAGHIDKIPAAEAVADLAAGIVTQRSDPACLRFLPDKLRELASESTLRALAAGPIQGDEDYHRASLTTFLENGWLARHHEAAGDIIIKHYRGVSNGMGRADAIAWKNWSLELPDNPEWGFLRRTAVRRWALEDPGQWETIPDLPGEDLRNAAYAAVAHSFDVGRGAEHISRILEKITDPALRDVATRVATARLHGEGDPFTAADIDPFHPLGGP